VTLVQSPLLIVKKYRRILFYSIMECMSPRALAVCFTKEMSCVIPTFSVLLANIVLIILVLHMVSHCDRVWSILTVYLDGYRRLIGTRT